MLGCNAISRAEKGWTFVLGCIFFLCIAPVLVAGPSNAQKLPIADGEIHLGVASCAGSTCHGAVVAMPGSNVLQNEFITWQEKDKHHRAYEVLLSDRSKRIAKNLGLGSAHKAELCLNCHTDNAPANKRHSTFQISSGVTCEACHGGAGRWIGTHITPTATHQINMANGLYPTSNPVARAQLCLSCHFGDQNRFVTHRIMGAGHPRMSFELDTFTAIEPAHFVVDSDYKKRGKLLASGVQTWAIGQAIALGMMLDVLLDPERGMDGFFPELVVFDCHACHSPMSKLQWSSREATGSLGPGIPKFNDANLLMLQVVTSLVDVDMGSRLKKATIKLHQSIRQDHKSMLVAAEELKQITDQLSDKFAKRNFDYKDMRAMLDSIIANGLKGEYVDYAGAEQASMAIGSITNGMVNSGVLKTAKVDKLNEMLEMVLVSVDSAELYEPKTFITSLQNFAQALK